MKIDTVMSGQSLLDMAVQVYGNADAAFDIALEAGMAITDEPAPGTVLPVPESARSDAWIAARYGRGGWRPATYITAENLTDVPYGGIDFMGIEIDFIVS